MEKQNRNNIENKQEQLIQDALRTGGFTFPQTVAEVEAFEKTFGTTDISLPEHLKVPDFIAKGKSKKNLKAQVFAMQPQDNFAVAAREGAAKVSDEIQKKMKEDRRRSDERYKKSNAKRK
jgi:hypothetical protein